MAKETDSRRNHSLREKRRAAGRLGGLATARKLGEESMAARGAKGGLITRSILGSQFYGHIARLRWARAARAKLQPGLKQV